MAKILNEFYLEIDRTKQSLEYPSWILDMYSSPPANPPAFLLEEYWEDTIRDYTVLEEIERKG